MVHVYRKKWRYHPEGAPCKCEYSVFSLADLRAMNKGKGPKTVYNRGAKAPARRGLQAGYFPSESTCSKI